MRLPSFSLLHDIADGGAGSGAPPQGSPSPSGPASGGAQPGSGGAGTGGGAPAGGAKQYTYTEDRSNWVPEYRVQQMSQKIREMEQRIGETERQYQGRVRALMGIDQPEDPRHGEIRQALAQVVPGLGPLLENPNLLKVFARLKPEQLDNFVKQIESGTLQDVQGTSTAYWNRHANDMTSQALDEYAKQFGVDRASMNPRASQRFAAQLRDFIAEDQSGQRLRRYEHADRTLISEFVADLKGTWGAPAAQRREVTNAAAQVESRRRLPQSGPRGVPTATAAGGEQKPVNSQSKEGKKAIFGAMRTALLNAASS